MKGYKMIKRDNDLAKNIKNVLKKGGYIITDIYPGNEYETVFDVANHSKSEGDQICNINEFIKYSHRAFKEVDYSLSEPELDIYDMGCYIKFKVTRECEVDVFIFRLENKKALLLE